MHTVRALSDTRIAGYLAIWGSPRQRDAYDTWFDKQNPPDLGLIDGAAFRLMYEHGLDPEVGKTIIGRVTDLRTDGTGIRFEAELDPACPHYPRILAEVKAGQLATSSGSAEHLAEFDADGRFKTWYLSELSLTASPAEPRMPFVKITRSLSGTHWDAAYDPLPDERTGEERPSADAGAPDFHAAQSDTKPKGELPMNKNNALRATLEELGLPADADAATLLAALIQRDGLETVMEMIKAMQQPAASEDGQAEGEAEMMSVPASAARNKPAPADLAAALRALMATSTKTDDTPTPASGQRRPRIDSVRDVRFDYAEPEVLAFGVQVARAVGRVNPANAPQISGRYMRALTLKTAQKIEAGDRAFGQIRSSFLWKDGRPIRSAEVMGTADTDNGAEWAEDLPGTVMWEKVRQEATLLDLMTRKGMDVREIPQGYKSETIPLEGADGTWYVAGEATDEDSGTGMVTPTYSSSKFGTGEKQVTVAKLSTRRHYTNEEQEDAILEFSQQALNKITREAPERMETVLLTGDTALTLNTNINLIDGTPAAAPARPDYTLLNGFLKLGLVTNTANARACGGTFDEADFLETLKLLPTAYRQNRDGLLFIVDGDTALAAANIASVKTRDVHTAATLENGVLTSIWKVMVYETGFMGLAQSADGKVSATPGNNTHGRLLLVRPDRWTMRWKRRLQVESAYNAVSDAWTIVGHMRFGLAYYDTDASAVTYGIPVTLS